MKNLLFGISVMSLLVSMLVASQTPSHKTATSAPSPTPTPTPRPTGCTIPGGYVPKPIQSPLPGEVRELNLDDIDNIAKGLDRDCDGISDFQDNCTRVWNPDQKDGNKNRIGDACEKKRKIKPRRTKRVRRTRC